MPARIHRFRASNHVVTWSRSDMHRVGQEEQSSSRLSHAPATTVNRSSTSLSSRRPKNCSSGDTHLISPGRPGLPRRRPLARQRSSHGRLALPGACRRPRHEPYPCQGGLTAGEPGASAPRRLPAAGHGTAAAGRYQEESANLQSSLVICPLSLVICHWSVERPQWRAAGYGPPGRKKPAARRAPQPRSCKSNVHWVVSRPSRMSAAAAGRGGVGSQ